MNHYLTIPIIIGSALVDSINPCAFAVLTILMTAALTIGNRQKAIWFGLAFTTSVFFSYLLMGLGLLKFINLTQLSHIFFIIISISAIILGIYNIKEFIWFRGSQCSLDNNQSGCRAPRIASWSNNFSSPITAFVLGFLVSLFELPCTGGPYIVILGLLSQHSTWTMGFIYLVLYNAIFILPLIVITLAIYLGLSSFETIYGYKDRYIRLIRLISGLLLIAIGTIMLTYL
jgi:cytochrome c biogenesis protein CcdA